MSYKLRDELVKVLRQEDFGKSIIAKLIRSIRKNATNPKTGRKFKQLEKRTKTHRKWVAKNNKTHADYKEKEPNLTITGRFLDSIKGFTSNIPGGLQLEIKATGIHARYKNSKGKLSGKKLKLNTDIHQKMADLGRDPINLSKKMENEISDKLLKVVSKALKKF